MTRAISASGGTGSAPGRVDSPPISRISAPACSMAWPAAIAASASKCRPPSEKLSGVMFRMPITSGRAEANPAKGKGRAVMASISSPHSSGSAATGRVATSRPSSISRASEKARSPPCKGSAWPSPMARNAAGPDSRPSGCNQRSRATRVQVAGAAPGESPPGRMLGRPAVGTLPRPWFTGSSGRLRTTGSPLIT